jgi:hypothetical protein
MSVRHDLLIDLPIKSPAFRPTIATDVLKLLLRLTTLIQPPSALVLLPLNMDQLYYDGTAPVSLPVAPAADLHQQYATKSCHAAGPDRPTHNTKRLHPGS